jgi:hypothetical protein
MDLRVETAIVITLTGGGELDDCARMAPLCPAYNAIRHAAYLQRKLLPTYFGLPGNRGGHLLELARGRLNDLETSDRVKLPKSM